MGILPPAPGVIGPVSLLAIVELICLVDLVVCISIVCKASIYPVDYMGVNVSGYLQCINAAWFFLGIPLAIIGGLGALFRVETHIKLFVAYLVGSLAVAIVWLGIFTRYAYTCKTIVPIPGQPQTDVIMECTGFKEGLIFCWFLIVVAVAVTVYLVWSYLEYVKKRLLTELLRYQEPWEASAMLAGDAAEAEYKQHRFAAFHKQLWASAANASSPRPEMQVPFAKHMQASYNGEPQRGHWSPAESILYQPKAQTSGSTLETFVNNGFWMDVADLDGFFQK